MSIETRNRITFGLGTIGRDMFYSLESTYLLYFFTEVRQLSDAMLAAVGGVLTVMRIFDAINDPIMGVIVDNTNTRFGKYKPWMLTGALGAAAALMLMFSDIGLTGTVYVVLFALFYLLWDLFYGLNDIAYWSMLPSLSLDQKQREKNGAFARICANIGMYMVVVGIIPITGIMTKIIGNAEKAWWFFALAVCILMVGFQLITIFGVKEKHIFKQEESTSLKDMVRVLVKNDQLLYTAIGMILFMVGYCTTTQFGTYFFKYAYKNDNMYSVFAVVLGATQLAALLVFPIISAKMDRKRMYTMSTILVVIGYIVFFLSPMNMLPIGIAGVLMFTGQAFIQLLMLMFLADTIEYGQWKLGKRNDSITFSVQPLINKLGAAIATGVITATLIISGINRAETPDDVTSQGLLIMKAAMLILPLISIVAGYLVYRAKYKIDKGFYEKIVSDLKERGDIKIDNDKSIENKKKEGVTC